MMNYLNKSNKNGVLTMKYDKKKKKKLTTKKDSKPTETKKSSMAKAMMAQGMPGAPVDVSDNVIGQEADAFFGPLSESYPSKDKKSKKYRLKKKKKSKDEMSSEVAMPAY